MAKRIRKSHFLLLVLTGLLYVVIIYIVHHNPQHQPQSDSVGSYTITPQSKTADCIASGGLPDHACTPGAVNSASTKEAICVSGYSSTVRNVTTAEKDAVYMEYGIGSRTPGEYEVDHLISLELGGSNDIANLWPEAANPTPGFHQKDEFENKLHAEVCGGTISLDQAQKEISSNWLQYYLPR